MTNNNSVDAALNAETGLDVDALNAVFHVTWQDWGRQLIRYFYFAGNNILLVMYIVSICRPYTLSSV